MSRNRVRVGLAFIGRVSRIGPHVRAANRRFSTRSSTERRIGPPARIICRFLNNEGEEIYGQPLHNPYSEYIAVENPFETKEGSSGARLILEPPIKLAKLLHPVANVPDIICCGSSSPGPESEGEKPASRTPRMSLMPSSALQNPFDPIYLPKCGGSQAFCKGELAIIIGKKGRNVREEAAQSHILGFTIANHLVLRNAQATADEAISPCESLATCLPLGPSITPAWAIDSSNLIITTKVGAKIVSEFSTEDLEATIPELIALSSKDKTLMPGTVILTGTPDDLDCEKDPAFCLKDGDKVEVAIEGIGKLSNHVCVRS